MRTTRSFPKLKGPAVLSPMAGVTDVAFRTLCKKNGASLTYTEFISGTALVRGSAKTAQLIATDPSEKPVAVQLFGSSVTDVCNAAKLIEDRFDIIDVNCGCPAWKVIKTGAGSEMLKNPTGISSFVNKLASAVSKPVTIKIRTGIDTHHINAIEVATAAENAGAAAIAIHGRTQQQGYRGTADWDIIRQVKEAVNIPVIGNGDVFSPEIFQQRLEASGVDAIMIARGAIGNPGIFRQITDYLKKGSYEHQPAILQYQHYLRLATTYQLPVQAMKTHSMQFTKGMIGGANVRAALAPCKTVDAIKDIVEQAIKTCNKPTRVDPKK